ncbi:MAG: glycosyltransferase family 4 protein [Candidatus Eisenbacteria bacterium]|nr:glycosyltransferase family 4 protein [Candidatus Eisenbacteria bacterium]
MSSFLFVNQAYRPDPVATAQLLDDLCHALAGRGHEVMVIAGDRGYDAPAERYTHRQRSGGIDVRRIPYVSLGKGGRMRRAVSFASFHARLFPALLSLPAADVVVALTSPPLLGATVAAAARLKRTKLVQWVMDLNPDEAIAAGWLREGGFLERVLRDSARSSYARSERVVALDTDMKARITERYGVSAERIEVIPPWDPGGLAEDAAGADHFRRTQGLAGKYVVMYSGNHSPCHPLGTLLDAALRLADRRDIVFCFIGGVRRGGSRAFCPRAHFGQYPAVAVPTDRELIRVFVGGRPACGGDGNILCGDRASE